MGMFDYFYSSYDLGEFFTDIQCQTKTIDEFDFGGSMSHYWLDPAGRLFLQDYAGTQKFTEVEQEEVEEGSDFYFSKYKIISTGKRGRLRPVRLTKYVEIYPQAWQGSYHEMPRLLIHFRKGVFVDCERP